MQKNTKTSARQDYVALHNYCDLSLSLLVFYIYMHKIYEHVELFLCCILKILSLNYLYL